jgi:hypothetical protein
MRSFFRKIFLLLPESIKQRISSNRSDVIERWEQQGKPSPPPHVLKQRIIKDYAKQYNCSVLVETGTYMGDMVYALCKNFKEVYSIELSDYLWRLAVKRFKEYPSVTILQGDSSSVLPILVPTLTTSAFFWLDGHYCGGITAQADVFCPIYGELEAIFKSPFQHVIMIDDARCFDGTFDYPTYEDLCVFVRKHRPSCTIIIRNDIIRILP